MIENNAVDDEALDASDSNRSGTCVVANNKESSDNREESSTALSSASKEEEEKKFAASVLSSDFESWCSIFSTNQSHMSVWTLIYFLKTENHPNKNYSN